MLQCKAFTLKKKKNIHQPFCFYFTLISQNSFFCSHHAGHFMFTILENTLGLNVVKFELRKRLYNPLRVILPLQTLVFSLTCQRLKHFSLCSGCTLCNYNSCLTLVSCSQAHHD